MIQRIHSGGEYEDKIGYCRTVIAGGFIHVSGTVGQGVTVVEQCDSALSIIESALVKAGVNLSQVVRVVYYLSDRHEFQACWPSLRAAFGENPPAATMIECGLIDPKYKIEIEVTAIAP